MASDSEFLPALPMSDAASFLRNLSTEKGLTNTLPSACHHSNQPLLCSVLCIPVAAGVPPGIPECGVGRLVESGVFSGRLCLNGVNLGLLMLPLEIVIAG